MSVINNDGVYPQQPGFFDSIKNFVGNIGDAIAKKTEQPPTQTTGYTGAGGARSRRRKCNKKHRHTKSCRKYVKKGRKTRKH
jgi:hypothetical protein